MTDFLQLSFSGVSLGVQYAFVALSITVILRASGILSIFQGAIVLLGGYFTYLGHQQVGLPFIVSVVLALALCAALNASAERIVLRSVSRRSEFVAVFVTFGLLLMTEQIVDSIWGSEALNMGDPWELHSLSIGALRVAERDVWAIGIGLVVLGTVYFLFGHTRLGLSMRANASDPVAAAAQGVRPGRVLGLSWALAGALGGLAGMFMATNVGGGVRPEVAVFAFAALPAIYLGGAGSPLGAVVGGLLIGLSQQYAAGYAPEWLGQGFSTVFPFLVLIAVLLLRPQGIFGTRAVRRA